MPRIIYWKCYTTYLNSPTLQVSKFDGSGIDHMPVFKIHAIKVFTCSY